MKTKWFWFIIIAAVILTACGSAGGQPENSSPPPLTPDPDPAATKQVYPTLKFDPTPLSPDTPVVIPMPTINLVPNESSMQLVSLAREDLSRALGVSADQITLVSVQETSWPDASLGCPKIGVFYIQVVTPGYIIQLTANGKNYTYHTDAKERVVRCVNFGPTDLPGTPEGFLTK